MTRRFSILNAATICLSIAAIGQGAEISGTINMLGCTVAPDQLMLMARAVRPLPGAMDGGILQAAGTAPLDTGMHVAKILRTGANRYSFSIGEVQLGAVYRLKVKLPAAQCGKVYFRGDAAGRVYGGQSGVSLTGAAVRHQVEILGSAKPGRSVKRWVGAESINLASLNDGTREVRAYTDLPNVKAFAIQVSTEKFQTDTTPRISDTGGISVPAVDACMADRPKDGVVWAEQKAVMRTGWSSLGSVNFRAPLQPPIGAAFSGDANLQRRMEVGAPLYVRAIPLTPTGPGGALERRCTPETDGFPGWAVIGASQVSGALGFTSKPEMVWIDSVEYTGPTVYNYPGSGWTCYRATQDYTVRAGAYQPFGSSFDLYAALYLAPFYREGETMPKNAVLCFAADDDSGWVEVAESFTDLVTGFIDGIGTMISEVARVYEMAKAAVAKVITSVLTFVGVPCDTDIPCGAFIQMGMEIGLAAMGMPPSLPNWDQLKEQGLDYLAAKIAAETGVPGAELAAKEAMNYAVKAVEEMDENRGGGSGLPPYLMPDLGLDPAVVKITLREDMKAPARTDVWKMSVADSPVYIGDVADIPKSFVKEWDPASYDGKLTIPIVLRSNLSKLAPFPPMPFNMPPPPYLLGLWNKNHWLAGLSKQSCAHFLVHVYNKPDPSTTRVYDYHIFRAPVFSSAYFGSPFPDGDTISYCTY